MTDPTNDTPERARRRARSMSPLPYRHPGGGSVADWMKLIAMLVGAGLVGGGGGALGASRLIEWRIEQLEERFREHGEVPHLSTQREIDRVAADSRAVDERRQADLRLVTDRLARIDARLGRIEEALDDQRHRR